MIKILKLTLYNLLFFLVTIIIIELTFGYWFGIRSDPATVLDLN